LRKKARAVEISQLAKVEGISATYRILVDFATIHH